MYYGLCFFNHGLRLVTQATWSHQLSHVEPPRRCPVRGGLALVSLAHSHTSPSLFYNYTHVAARESSVCRRYVATIVLSSPHGL